MPADYVEIILALRNVAQFVSGARQASGAVEQVGTEAEKTGKKAQSSWKGLAKWAGGAYGLYAATRYVRGAVSATGDLAKATLGVSRVTGMDTQTSSEWAALMKERGVSTRQFQTNLVKLSRTIEASRGATAKESQTVAGLRAQIDQVAKVGGKKAPAEIDKLSKAIARAQVQGEKGRQVLAQLGVAQGDVAKGNTGAILYRVADALKAMHNPAQRAALTQQLFGRASVALLPILMKGAKGVRELLNEQKAAGNYISGKGIKSAKQLIVQQRALSTALAGVKVQLGTALMPVLISVGGLLVGLLKIMRPLTKNATLFKIAIAALAIAFVAYKIAMIAATIATVVFDTAAAPIVGIVLGVIAAIALLAIGFYLLWKHVKVFRDAMKFTWNWIKANWPLLLAVIVGPIGIAAYAVIKNFDLIKQTARSVVDGIKAVFDELVAFFRRLPGRIGNWMKKVPGIGLATRVAGGLGSAVHGVGSLLHRQAGGAIPRGWTALVGERGPELVTAPTGAHVTPLQADMVGGGGGGRPLEIVVPVVVDGRQIARATARVAANQLARR